MGNPRGLRPGYSLIEAFITGILVCGLLAIAMPLLADAREISRRDQCADQQRRLWGAWNGFMRDHQGALPYVADAAPWNYGGVRFSPIDGQATLDSDRPLNGYLPPTPAAARVYRSPSDQGIRGDAPGAGTAGRTAFEAFGTSYRANGPLLDARRAGVDEAPRGLRPSELWPVPSRIVLMGTPIWFEVYEETGRDADWNRDNNRGNLLFLDGSVRFQAVLPRGRTDSTVIDAVDPRARRIPLDSEP